METIALLATIIAGIAALYAILFGSKPLLEAIRRPKEDINSDTDRTVQEYEPLSKLAPLGQPVAMSVASEQGDDMLNNDEFVLDELAIELLVERANELGHATYNDLLTYQQRLLENVEKTRRYGDTADRKAERAEIINRVNSVALDVEGKPFNQLRKQAMLPQISPTSTLVQPPDSTRHILEVGRPITTYTLEIRRLVESSDYRAAVERATIAQREVEALGESTDPDDRLSVADFHVWHSHALIYTGQTDLANRLLHAVITNFGDQRKSIPSQRQNSIVGRAHNHIGYMNWMVNGNYEDALKEFASANSHFTAGKCDEENATALDNIGRVYAHLGHASLAMLLIERGRKQRQVLKNKDKSSDNYRYGLSLHSSAVAHLMFGHPYRAVVLCEEAFQIFDSLRAQHGFRGVGLASLTWGTAERYLSAFWKNRNYDKAERHLSMAEVHLVRAARIFGATDVLHDSSAISREVSDIPIGSVLEPIRLVQAYGELGCVYRERVFLSGGADISQFDLAKHFFARAVKVAEDHGYDVLSADTCEDMANTYYRAGEYGMAKKWLHSAETAIPASCRLNTRVESTSATIRGRSEDFWQQLGKIHALRGNIEIQSLLGDESEAAKIHPERLRAAIGHYVLAVSYFDRFLTRPLSPENAWLYPDLHPHLAHHMLFTGEIYDRLGDLKLDDLSIVRTDILPSLYEEHQVSDKVRTFFNRGLELLLHMAASTDLNKAEFYGMQDA